MRRLLFAFVLCACLYNTAALEKFEIFEIESEADAQGNTYNWSRREIAIRPGTPEEGARLVFEDFFAAAAYCVPEGVRVLSVEIDEDCLILDVSGDILRYGGNAYERALVAQCVRTALALPGVEYFTLLVEGELQPLTEGRTVEKYTENS
jgi:hypothetical protein